jgi:hypothetical protein
MGRSGTALRNAHIDVNGSPSTVDLVAAIGDRIWKAA